MTIARLGLPALLAATALVSGCASEGPQAALTGQATNVAATTARGGVDNFMLVAAQSLEAYELYRLADAKAVVFVTQANGDPVLRAQGPALKALKAAYAGKGVELMMLNSSLKDTHEGIVAEARTAGYDLPILMDSYQLVGEGLGVTRSAEVIVVDPKTWKVAWRGALADAGAAKALDALIAGQAVTVAAAGPGAGAPVAFPERGVMKATFVKDVAPILEAKCVSCHQTGGIGPFAMSSYEMVKGFSPMIREVIRTDRMPPYNADPHIGKFSDNKNLSPAEIKTIVHWVEAGAPRGEGADPLAAVKRVAMEWPLGKPDLVLNIPEYKVPATGVVDYQRPLTKNPNTEGRWIRATSVKPGDRQAVHHVLSGWMPDFPSNSGGRSSEGRWRNSVGRYAVGSEADIYDGDVATYLPPGGAVGFQMHYTPYGKETTDASQIAVYFRKDAPKYIMRQTVVSDPTITIPPNTARHMEQAYLEFPKDALLYDAFVHAHYRAYSSDLWIQYPDGKKKLLLTLPRYDFNWQRAYTFAEPVKIPAGSRLIAHYVYDNSKRNPANPDPSAQVTWGEQSWEEMLFTQLNFRWLDETAANQIDSDARLQDGRVIGAMDDDLDGKVAKAELRGQFGRNLLARFDMIDTNKDGAIDRPEMAAAMAAMGGGRRSQPAPAAPTAASSGGGK